MPKKRQIPFLFAQRLADGSTVWHWKPSKELRASGFVNQRLGKDERTAVTAAIDLNAQLANWRRSQAGEPGAENLPKARLPRVMRFAELVTTYRGSADFTDLAPKTRMEYDVRLRQLAIWALDGTLAVRDVTDARVVELRNGLMKGSRHRAAAILRVLRLLLSFAEREGIIPKGSNPAAKVRIPEPASRRVMMPRGVRDAIVEAAIELGEPEVELSIPLGFWTVQRQADILSFNRLAWRQLSDSEADPRHAAVLAGARGHVLGFRIQQHKTGVWIDAPLPPALHDRIEAHWRDKNATWLFPHPDDANRPMPGYLLQRRFRACQDAAVSVAIMRGDLELAEQIDVCQFRDLRRTGMTFYGAHTKIDNVTALSGHAVLGKKTILDVYMPGNTAGAMACVASGVVAWDAAEERRSKAG